MSQIQMQAGAVAYSVPPQVAEAAPVDPSAGETIAAPAAAPAPLPVRFARYPK